MHSSSLSSAVCKSWIADIESGHISIADLRSRQQRLDKEVRDTLDEKTADEEAAENGQEESESAQDRALGGNTAITLDDLKAERIQVQQLLDLAIQPGR